MLGDQLIITNIIIIMLIGMGFKTTVQDWPIIRGHLTTDL